MSAVMSFEDFKSLMDTVRSDYAWMDSVSYAIHSDFLYENLRSPGVIMNLLCQEFHDEKDDWIGYFAFELDWGKDYSPGAVTDKEGKEIPLATYEDLYAVLVNNMKE